MDQLSNFTNLTERLTGGGAGILRPPYAGGASQRPARQNCSALYLMDDIPNTAGYILSILAIVFVTNLLHALLKSFSQPRFVSEMIVGIFVGKFLPVSKSADLSRLIYIMVQLGMVGYMLVLGLEMDPITLLTPANEPVVALAGMVPPFLLVYFLATPLRLTGNADLVTKFCLGVLTSSTTSPLLTRMMTDLKIGKSDIGRFATSAGAWTDLAVTVTLAVTQASAGSVMRAVRVVIALLVHIFSTLTAGSMISNWVNERNPSGKPVKESHLVVAVAFIGALCASLTAFGLLLPYSAFFVGLFLPREGRISKMLVGKINFLLGNILYPFLFVYTSIVKPGSHQGQRTNPSKGWSFIVFLSLLGITVVGKLIGTFLAGVALGLHKQDAVVIGLFLAVKGYPNVYAMGEAVQGGFMSPGYIFPMLGAIFCTVVYIPLVGSYIIKRARKRSPMQRMALQWLDAVNELRVLLCLRDVSNVPAGINFMEITRGTSDPGIVVYATDMIELTEAITTTLVQGEGVDAIAVSEMRKQITDSFERYVAEIDGVTLRRMLALSAMTSMHQDVCTLAEDLMVTLIVLPFHNCETTPFRAVNRKILRHAPCSVGILVDRGLGAVGRISASGVVLSVAVIFIGGTDDREALAYSGHIAHHPGVRLTVTRFMSNSAGGEGSTQRAGRHVAEEERQMKADDECLAEFFERHVDSGHVSYLEKYLANSSEAYTVLQALERQYGLIIVGRGGRVNSVLTAGMNDWQQCPELGPIGDLLSGTHFSSSASVLIIQQHILKGRLDGLDDEFSIM